MAGSMKSGFLAAAMQWFHDAINDWHKRLGAFKQMADI